MKTLLAAICVFTLLATGLLTLSVVLLQPPRVNYREWWLLAALFAAQSMVTLVAVAGLVSGGWIRWLLLAGGVGIMAYGAFWVHATLSSPHFEGYALILGSALVVQGMLTLAYVSAAFVRTLSAAR